jgi:PPK2 family polyphosphate:nucleotide phosphotransferase
MLKPIAADHHVSLTDADARPPRRLPAGDARDRERDELRDELELFQQKLYAEGTRALLIVLQGRDASGKDGLIRKVLTAFSPQGCTVTSFKAPTGAELRHDFLWRVHAAVPQFGTVGVFNRSHYEDVLVPRAHRTMERDALDRRYDQINAFEQLLCESGVRVVKFMLHVSRDEQRARLRKRLSNADKNWKFNAHDVEERALWDAYTEAYETAIARCSTDCAPWYIVPADRKPARDLLVARVLARIARDMAPEYPVAEPGMLMKASEVD